MRKLYILATFLITVVNVFSQTILDKPETGSRIVQDPTAVILTNGFHANSTTSNPFVAKIGASTEAIPTPTDSNAGAGNPSGIVGSNNFHDTQGNIEVNGGGQLQFTLPIALPPGVKSVAPQINLVYTSGSGNGIAGYGWNLSGITSITRMSKTIEKDGEVKGIQLDNTDYFSFNGQRLLLKSGEYGKDGAEYVTEKYSNVKIKSVGSTQVSRVPVYFEVTFEDGSQAWYGEIENDPEYNRYNARTAVEYNIVKWMDVQGNSILYTYDYTTGQMQGGVSRISTIRWGGNELLNKPHYNEIKFNYIDRDLKEESYVHGFRFLQDKLLSNIQVNTNGTQFKKYEISYKKDGNGTNYQYLDRITEYNSRGESANPVVFTNTVSQSSSWKSEFFYQNDDNDKITGDFDGDGKIDYLKYFDSYTQCTASEIQEVPYDDGTTNTYQSEVCTNWEEKPAGIYLVKGILDHSSGDKIYLGNSISKEDLTKAIIVSTKDNTGIVKSIPRLVVPKYFVNNNGTSDVEFRFYDIGSEISYLYSKFIPNADYDISNSSNGYDLTTSLGDTESIDVDGDGISELLVSFVDQECHYEDDRDPYNPYPINYCNENRRYFVLSTDPQIKSNYFNEVSNIYVFTSFSKDYKSGDFNGDGLVDYLRINYDKIPYLLQFKKDTSGKYIAEERAFNSGGTVLGLGDKGYVGDFNGDGKSDLIVPESEGSFNWNLYISDGGKFIQQSLPNFSYYRPFSSATSDGKTNYYFRSYVVQDLNLDGKSDFIELHSKTRVLKVSGQWSAFILNFKENKGIDGSGKIAFENRNIDGHSEAILPLPTWLKQTMDEYPYLYFKDGKWQGSSPKSEATIGSSNMKTLYPYSILAGNFRISDANRQIIVMNKQKRHLFSYYSVSETARISSITQGGIRTDIAYKELDGSTNPGFYAPVKKEPYPYVELEKVAQSYAVSQLRQSITVGGIEKIRKQDFRYRGFLAHLQGRGMIGFRQSARSSWYTDEFINTKIWSGAEIDPLKEGVPIKEWSIKTTDENQIFPSDLSVNNTKLLSFKSTDYRQDNLALGVKALVPVTTTSKDFLKNITTISSIIYNQYYLPTQTVTNTNSGFAIATTNLEYLYNPNGIGKDYYIGRPKSKTELMQAYGDSKGAKEEYEYDNNQLKTKTSWNRDNTGWIKETYLYDGFGNIIQKEATNSIDNNKKTEKAEYDTAGRFVVKKTDNLGLITSIKYNNWGQVEEQTDPLGVKLNNTYDGWGKILTSKTNLSGITSYTYEKQDNGDTKVTQYDPDGGETITFTNKIGQNYKTVTKSFNKGSYVSKEVGYDALGRKTYETEPRYDGKESPKLNTIEYDDYSRPVKAIAFTGKVVETKYDDAGRSVTTTETNANNRFKKQTMDPLGNITSSQDMGGTINFKYNAAGENIEANYEGNIVKTAYDAWGNKVRFEDPSNGVYIYEYKGYFGALSKSVSPKGEKNYTFNAKGQLITQTEKSTDGTNATDKTISFSYNDKGLMLGKSGTSKGKSFGSSVTYDSYGRMLSSSESSNGRYYMQKGIIYDDKSRITSYEKSLYSSGVYTKATIENVYDTWSGELSQVKDKTTGKALWILGETNSRGQVMKARLGAVDITNTYDPNGFLSNINHSTPAKTILQIGYRFNAIKNELNSRSTGGDFNIVESFEYDSNNRLTKWTNPVTGAFDQTNVYDNKGRIVYNNQVGTVKFDNPAKRYQPTSITLNAEGTNNYNNDLIQSIVYNENNDPVFIDGVRGDVRFEYGLTEMRQMATYGGNFANTGEGKFTKYYSEDGSFEVTRNNQTGEEKHILYIGGSPYEANIVYLKNYKESSGSYKFLHKDYLGSILAISDEAGNKIEQRHFDAWGNLTHLQINGGAIVTDENQIRDFLSSGGLLVDRGYTSHEHFAEVGLIHMNGRLYDPLLRRFLNADENIQDMFNTQNYNKYGYVLNNPLMYNDPSGEVFFLIPLVGYFWSAVIVGAVIGAASYLVSSAIMGQAITLKGFLKSTLWGGISGAVTFGIGSIFSVAGSTALTATGTAIKEAVGGVGLAIVQAGTHAVAQGVMSLMQGGTFQQAFWSGALGSLGAYAFGAVVGSDFANKALGQITFGALGGGIGAELSGGNFWQGALIGGVVAGLNHAMHKMSGFDNGEDPRKPLRSKRLISKSKNHSLSKGSRGGQSVITRENPTNQVGNGKGMFAPTGSQSMTTSDLTYYDDGTVDVNMTTQVAKMNTTGSYIANYDIVGPNGNIIDAGFLVNKGFGINARMDYRVYTTQGSAAVLSTAKFTVPLNSVIRVNVGLTYKIPAGATGAITTTHIIRVR